MASPTRRRSPWSSPGGRRRGPAGWGRCSSIRAVPGGSGIEYATYFSNRGLENYDIVGWDPRGVGASTPVECFGENDLDRYYAMDASPDDGSELTARIEAVRAFGQSCLERSGTLLEHISTVETVRDLDLLRGLVGDDKLNYYGVSYGTRIGSLYAELYGNRVGRMVLDASINIGKDDKITQIEGFERALGPLRTLVCRATMRTGRHQGRRSRMRSRNSLINWIRAAGSAAGGP